jgi:outer membrane protein insertion porin family
MMNINILELAGKITLNIFRYYPVLFLTILSILPLHTKIYAKDNKIVDIQISLRNGPLDPSPILERAREHIELHKGKPFSQSDLLETISSLKQTRIFKDVTSDQIHTPDGVIIVFQMTACNVIKDIRISGAFPLFEREVLNVMTISPGQIWLEDRANVQIDRIKNLYQREGFVDSNVEIHAKHDIRDGYYVVDVLIDAGRCARLKKLDINGNLYSSDFMLQARMKTWQVSYIPGNAGCFKENQLRNDVLKLMSWYRENGYADVLIRSTVDRHDQRVHVKLNVQEGTQYQVHFIGNHYFSHHRLKKCLSLFTKGNRNDTALRRSTRAILNLYRQAGFLNANLHISNWMKMNEKGNIQHVWFNIYEGPRTCIEKIEFIGNQLLTKKQIQKQMKTQFPGYFGDVPFQPGILNEDIPAIKELYQRHGILHPHVKKEIQWQPDKTKVIIYIHIDEGTETILRSVSFSGNISEIQSFQLPQLLNQPLNEKQIKNIRQMIEAHVSDQGFPYVMVKENIHLTSDRRKADIIFHVYKGKKVRVGHVFFHGNFKTRRSELQEVLSINRGDVFSLSKTLRAQQNLRDMKIFNSVKLSPLGLKEKKDEIHLFVEVEEKKPLFLELGGGYKTEKGAFGHIKMGDKNLFGKNKSTWIRFEQSEVGYHGEFNIHEPDLFGERIDTGFAYYIERLKEFNQTYGTQTYGWSLNLNRGWTQNIRSDINFRYERRRKFLRELLQEDQDSGLSAEELQPRSLIVTTPSIVYDSRNSFIRPKKGVYASYAMDISKGIANSLDDFIKYYLEIRGYHAFHDYLNIALTGRCQNIQAFGSLEKIPEDQLLYLGGSSDVRGFKENMFMFDEHDSPVGGESFLSGSIEARFDVGFNFEIFCFFDAGQLLKIRKEVPIKNLRCSSGGGLRYHTPIGPIGFMYGVKNHVYGNEDRGRLHFSVGYSF